MTNCNTFTKRAEEILSDSSKWGDEFLTDYDLILHLKLPNEHSPECIFYRREALEELLGSEDARSFLKKVEETQRESDLE